MVPTLLNGHHVQTLPLKRRLEDSGIRSCIVAFRHPNVPGQIYVKRVVGLPNEHVAIRNGGVEINGAPLAEPYLKGGVTNSAGRATQWFTDWNELFLLGDNRADSDDSRSFGPIPADLVIGRVWIRYWPPRYFRNRSG